MWRNAPIPIALTVVAVTCLTTETINFVYTDSLWTSSPSVTTNVSFLLVGQRLPKASTVPKTHRCFASGVAGLRLVSFSEQRQPRFDPHWLLEEMNHTSTVTVDPTQYAYYCQCLPGFEAVGNGVLKIAVPDQTEYHVWERGGTLFPASCNKSCSCLELPKKEELKEKNDSSARVYPAMLEEARPAMNCTAVQEVIKTWNGSKENRLGNSKMMIGAFPATRLLQQPARNSRTTNDSLQIIVYLVKSRLSYTQELKVAHLGGDLVAQGYGHCRVNVSGHGSIRAFGAKYYSPIDDWAVNLDKFNWPGIGFGPCLRIQAALSVTSSIITLNKQGFVYKDWKWGQWAVAGTKTVLIDVSGAENGWNLESMLNTYLEILRRRELSMESNTVTALGTRLSVNKQTLEALRSLSSDCKNNSEMCTVYEVLRNPSLVDYMRWRFNSYDEFQSVGLSKILFPILATIAAPNYLKMGPKPFKWEIPSATLSFNASQQTKRISDSVSLAERISKEALHPSVALQTTDIYNALDQLFHELECGT